MFEFERFVDYDYVEGTNAFTRAEKGPKANDSTADMFRTVTGG